MSFEAHKSLDAWKVGIEFAKEFIQFLYIAHGSLSELDTQLHIAAQVGYLKSHDQTPVAELLEKVSKLISELIRKRKISLNK